MSETKRILVADPSPAVIDLVKRVVEPIEGLVLYTAATGKECLEKVESLHPHLVIAELTLPYVHGLDLLRQLKQDPKTASIGFVLSTWRAVHQDYQIAIESGADYYLLKPFSEASLKKIIDRFLEGHLQPASFPLAGLKPLPEAEAYNPTLTQAKRYIRFWGTRGSIPVSGQEYLIHGGNTVCLEVCDSDNLVIIDAGSGIRELGSHVLNSSFKEIHLFIGHTHWDHILGFPFFAPVYSAKYDIHIYAAKGFGKDIPDLFHGMLDCDYFPVKLEEMQARLIFHDLKDNQPITIGKIKVAYTYANHPGATLCFKIEMGEHLIGYATDNEVLTGFQGHPHLIDYYHPLLFPYRNLIDFFTGCQILVHEAQYLPAEYRYKTGWGHSSISNAAVFVKHCKAPHWIVTHHDPDHSDPILREKQALQEKVLEEAEYSCKLQMAYDGLLLPL